MYQDWPQADGGHEDDVFEGRLERIGFFHRAAAEFDDDQPIAKLANVAERFNERLSLADGVVHGRGPWARNKRLIVGGIGEASIEGSEDFVQTNVGQASSLPIYLLILHGWLEACTTDYHTDSASSSSTPNRSCTRARTSSISRNTSRAVAPDSAAM